MIEFKIGPNEANQRFDKYLNKSLKQAPTSFIYKMLRKKNITLNGKKATGNEKICEGDVVKLFLSDETIEKFSAKQGEEFKVISEVQLDIIYEDDNILLINKPAGMLSQKASDTDISLNELMISYLINTGKLSKEELKTFKPSICNRLDRNTTGIIAAGKSLMGLQELSRLFKERIIDKYYITIVVGKIEDDENIKGYLIKDEKTNTVKVVNETTTPELFDYIETQYEPIVYNEVKGIELTMLKVKLITGKTHQIRAHLSSIGSPIVGDYKYGDEEINKKFKLKYQLLHSCELSFKGIDGGLDYLNGKVFYAPMPIIYNKVMQSN